MSEQQQWQVKRRATHLQCAETKVNLKSESQLSFKNEDRIKTFSEKHKVQEFTATHFTEHIPKGCAQGRDNVISEGGSNIQERMVR